MLSPVAPVPEWALLSSGFMRHSDLLMTFGNHRLRMTTGSNRGSHHSILGLLIPFVLLIGCEQSDAQTGAPPLDGGMCVESPDTECPEEVPFPGAACAGDLSCTEFPSLRGFHGRWSVRCNEGTWEIQDRPRNHHTDAEHPLPASEYCRDPFQGERSDAELQVGPADGERFSSFAENAEVRLVRGGQGSHMLEFRLDVAGARDLSCLLIEAEVQIDGGEPASLSVSSEFLCGSTRKVYIVVNPPDHDCDAYHRGETEREYPLELQVTLPGLDEMMVPLRLIHTTCPEEHLFG